MGYKVYLKGFGYIKKRYTRKPKIYPTRLGAKRRLNLEKRRGKWEGMVRKVIRGR